MIPVFKPALDQEEWLALKEPLEKGWLGLGPKTKEFEEKFAEYAVRALRRWHQLRHVGAASWVRGARCHRR